MRAEIGDREFMSGSPQSRRHAQNRSPLSPAQPLLGKTEKRATTSLLPPPSVCCLLFPDEIYRAAAPH